LAIGARRAKRSPGATGIIGLIGIAQTAIAPEGTVFIRGELWPARATLNISLGENVRVTGFDGIALEVEGKEQALAGNLMTTKLSCGLE